MDQGDRLLMVDSSRTLVDIRDAMPSDACPILQVLLPAGSPERLFVLTVAHERI